MWQEMIVGLCVLLALAFVLRRYFLPAKKTAGSCGGCGGCGSQRQGCQK